MPTSSKGGKTEIAQWVANNNIKKVLDVGPGDGTYSKLFKENNIFLDTLDGVEIWEPYVERYSLKNLYTNIFVEDIRSWNNFDYDLVIFGDVLEHMSKQDAISVWSKTSKLAKYAIISIPIVHYPQDECEGNPYEAHVKDDWTVQEVLDTFTNIVNYFESGILGIFIANFEKD
jgi:hypothetical protein